MSLKDSWKQVGKDFGSLGKDLGTSIVKSVKQGAKKVSEIGEDKKEEPKADVVIDPQPENQEPEKKEE